MTDPVQEGYTNPCGYGFMFAKTVKIDESRCDGCGLCVKACHEGAIQLVDGKARLVHVNMCDGLGDCLPACPRNAITLVDSGIMTPGPMPGLMATPGVQWPIQLGLVSVRNPMFDGDIVIASDCSAFVVDDFKKTVLRGRPVVIGCPKLDDRARFDKLKGMFSENDVKSVEVVRMEVPCCGALVNLVKAAVAESGKNVDVKVTTVSRDGRIL